MESEPKCWLMTGPFAERRLSGRYERYLTPQGAIHIPLDESFELTDGEPFAHAIYWNAGIGDSSEGIVAYSFHKIERVDGQPFQVRFIGGPLNGVRTFHQPAHVLSVVLLPLPSEPYDGDGRLRVIAQYHSAGHELHFDQIHKQVTKDLRVVYDLSGGAFDGCALDTDAMDSDRDGAFKARALYVANKGEKGKCFPLTSPFAWKQVEEHGRDAPFRPMFKYRIIDCLRTEYEVLVRAEYVGPYPDKSNGN